jgi:hypothetical protein
VGDLGLRSALLAAALLKVVALAGGGLKTQAGEASTSGLLAILAGVDPEEQKAVLMPIAAGLDSVAFSGKQDSAKNLQRQIETRLAELDPAARNMETARREVEILALEYEKVRNEEKASPVRTSHMANIVTRVKTLANASAYTADELHSLFATGGDGKRLIVLAILRATVDVSCFDLVVNAIRSPKSAFEQWHALAVAESMLPALGQVQREQLIEALNYQRSGQPNTYLAPGPQDRDRRRISDRLLAALNGAGN